MGDRRTNISIPAPSADIFSVSNPMLNKTRSNTGPSKAIEQLNTTPIWTEDYVGPNTPVTNTRNYIPNYIASTSEAPGITNTIRQKSTHRRTSLVGTVPQPWRGRASQFSSPVLKPAMDVMAVAANPTFPSRSHPLQYMDMGVATRRLPIEAAGGARAKTRRRRRHRRRTLTRKSRR